MSKCYKEDDLLAFLDGELQADKHLAIEAHVMECAQCAKLLQYWDGVTGQLADNAEVESSEAFVQSVMQRICPEEEPVSILTRLGDFFSEWRFQLAGAALAVLLLVYQPFQGSSENVDLALASDTGQVSIYEVWDTQLYGVDTMLGLQLEDL